MARMGFGKKKAPGLERNPGAGVDLLERSKGIEIASCKTAFPLLHGP